MLMLMLTLTLTLTNQVRGISEGRKEDWLIDGLAFRSERSNKDKSDFLTVSSSASTILRISPSRHSQLVAQFTARPPFFLWSFTSSMQKFKMSVCGWWRSRVAYCTSSLVLGNGALLMLLLHSSWDTFRFRCFSSTQPIRAFLHHTLHTTITHFQPVPKPGLPCAEPPNKWRSVGILRYNTSAVCKMHQIHVLSTLYTFHPIEKCGSWVESSFREFLPSTSFPCSFLSYPRPVWRMTCIVEHQVTSWRSVCPIQVVPFATDYTEPYINDHFCTSTYLKLYDSTQSE